MSQPSGDEFTDAMWQHMQTVNNAATAEINRLRKALRLAEADRDEAKAALFEVREQLWQAVDELARRGEPHA